MPKGAPLNILVKLPVKIGDTVMAAFVLRGIKEQYPDCQLDVIMAKWFKDLAKLMPYIDEVHEFSKNEFPGPIGNFRYGKEIGKKKKYDLFICLPLSFSSATVGFFTGSKIRTGFHAEHRSLLFTKPIDRLPGLHIVEEFNYVFERYSGKKIEFRPLGFQPEKSNILDSNTNKFLILNVRSGPPSRSIPIDKSISIANVLLETYPHDIILIGAQNETKYVSQVKDSFSTNNRVVNLAGKTDLMELAYVLSKAEVVVTTDSGSAHIANAVGTPTVVLFGAEPEHRARPYDQSISKTLRVHDLKCAPCTSEYCKYNDNRCLSTIENSAILKLLNELIS